MSHRRELTEDMHLCIPLVGNVVLDLWAEEPGSRVHARSVLLLLGCTPPKYKFKKPFSPS